jgi:hypothetical protein
VGGEELEKGNPWGASINYMGSTKIYFFYKSSDFYIKMG